MERTKRTVAPQIAAMQKCERILNELPAAQQRLVLVVLISMFCGTTPEALMQKHAKEGVSNGD